MKIIKKTIINTVIFMIVISLFVSVIPVFCIWSRRKEDYDNIQYRKSLNGSIDTLFIGASQSFSAIQPKIADENLGYNSYLYAAANLTMKSRYSMLKCGCRNNPIRRVYLEVSFDAMLHDDCLEGNIDLTSRFSNFFVCYIWFLSQNNILDTETILSTMAQKDTEYFYSLINKTISEKYNVENRGFRPHVSTWTESPDCFSTNDYDLILSDKFTTENIKYFEKIVKYCKKNNIELTLINIPDTYIFISYHPELDKILNSYKVLTEKYDIPYYDFNLLKDSDIIMSDIYCYWNETHLCTKGANVFMNQFTDVMKKVNAGDDISDLFYSSYEEMKSDSPYSNYICSVKLK